MAFEKGQEAIPYVAEGRALKAKASKADTPSHLLTIPALRPALLTASGISAKAARYLDPQNEDAAMDRLIESFLEPASEEFVDELVFRYLLIRGDSLGGRMRNIAGIWGERRLTRVLIANLRLASRPFQYHDRETREWRQDPGDDARLETRVCGLHWANGSEDRCLLYNLPVDTVGNNVDLCLLDATPEQVARRGGGPSRHREPERYIALGELKSGVDPAGADEHWKTARSALERIRSSFAALDLAPRTFFIGAAIETAMAEEIFAQLRGQTLHNAANLTVDDQLDSICTWLINL
jgi:type II restriction enzyme